MRKQSNISHSGYSEIQGKIKFMYVRMYVCKKFFTKLILKHESFSEYRTMKVNVRLRPDWTPY